MPSFCVVSTCEHKYASSDNLSFHKFPHHSPELLGKWIKFADRGSDWKPSRWSSICGRHFLPSDFRHFTSRRWLKKDAVPSVTMKQFVGNFLDLKKNKNNMKDPEQDCDAECRLCGLQCKERESFASNFEIFSLIKKCFPTLNVQQDDNFSKSLCTTCLNKLMNFSSFIDDVQKTQRDLEEKFTYVDATERKVLSDDRPLTIKQEPIVKVKQEHNEDIYNYLNEDMDSSTLEEQSIEEKSQIFDLPLFNSQDIINNCDIMEIINLEDAFIDIPDDEAAEETSKVESKVHCVEEMFDIFNVSEEHNYAKVTEPEEDMPNCKVESIGYKTEVTEDVKPKQTLTQPTKTGLDIVVIDDSIIMPSPSQLCVFNCNLCQSTFSVSSDLESHIKLTHSETNKRQICSKCNQEFNSIYDYLYHKSKFHRNRKKYKLLNRNGWSCALCGKQFLRKLALNNHRKYICEQQRGKCKFCGETFSKWMNLKHHHKTCPKKVKSASTILRRVPEKRRKTPKIRPNEKGLFACNVCGRSYTRRHNLYKHQSQHRPPEEWNFKCGDCDALFDHMHDLRKHLKSTCSKAVQKTEEINFVCTTCGKHLKTFQRLKLHAATHVHKKSYVCETCGKAFRNFNNLYQHRITHSDVRRHKCELCDKVFKRRGGLNQHKKAYHLKLRPHECPVCKRKFALKGDMQRCKHSALKSMASSVLL